VFITAYSLWAIWKGSQATNPRQEPGGLWTVSWLAPPGLLSLLFFISHSITSIEIKNMLKGLAYRQSDRGIFSVEVTSSQDGSSLCQVHKKQTQQTGILSHILQ
jgi:hypothetical protein